MSGPYTTGRGLIVPNTGDLPGTWGSAAINPDMAAIDGMFAGFTTISLAAGSATLSVPSGFTATPGAGPTDSQTALIILSGTLTANQTVTFPCPGYYIVENTCAGSFLVTLQSSTPGNVICAPPGDTVHVFCDGVNMRYVNIGRVGSYVDYAISAIPTWITNCTVPPALYCDGSTFNSTTYPKLAAYLGGTTLPDFRGRAASYLNDGTGRITIAGSGIDGNTLLASGGAEAITLTGAQMPAHSHGVTDPGHTHGATLSANQQNSVGIGGGSAYIGPTTGAGSISIASATTGISTQTSGSSAAHSNMNPTVMAGIRLIWAA